MHQPDTEWDMESEERRSRLRRWGFECQCSLCAGPKEALEASDRRRSEIADLKEEVVSVLQKGRFYRAIKITKDIIRLMETEGLTPLLSTQYDTIGRIYWAINDKVNAEVYARKRVDMLVKFGFAEAGREDAEVKKVLLSYDD